MTHRRPPLGRHFLLDIAGAPFDLLDDPVEIEEALVTTSTASGPRGSAGSSSSPSRT